MSIGIDKSLSGKTISLCGVRWAMDHKWYTSYSVERVGEYRVHTDDGIKPESFVSFEKLREWAGY